jgi:hypothetical protein
MDFTYYEDDIAALWDRYGELPADGRGTFVSDLLEKAASRAENAFGLLEDAKVYLERVLAFAKEAEEQDGLRLEPAKIARAQAARERLTESRILTKRDTLRAILGDDEYDGCFALVSTLTANEALYQYVCTVNKHLCVGRPRDGRQRYAWLNEAMARRLAKRGRGSRNTAGLTLSDIREAKAALERDMADAPQAAAGHPTVDVVTAELDYANTVYGRSGEYFLAFERYSMRPNQFGLYQVMPQADAPNPESSGVEAAQPGASQPGSPPVDPALALLDLSADALTPKGGDKLYGPSERTNSCPLPGQEARFVADLESGTVNPADVMPPPKGVLNTTTRDAHGSSPMLSASRQALGGGSTMAIDDDGPNDDEDNQNDTSSEGSDVDMESIGEPDNTTSLSEPSSHEADGVDYDEDAWRGSIANTGRRTPMSEAEASLATCTCGAAVPKPLRLWAHRAAGVGTRAGLGIDAVTYTLTDEAREGLRLYFDTVEMADGSGLYTICRNTRRLVLKMLYLSTNISSEDMHKRVSSLWEMRDDLVSWRRLHEKDGWLSGLGVFPGDADYIPLYRHSACPLKALEYDADLLLRQLLGPSHRRVVEELEATGNVVHADGFDWIREENSNLIALMREEMDAILYHTRSGSRAGKHYKGWSNASHYTLCQQLARQDLWFWAVTAALREDHAYQLSCIPAQAKHAVAGDRTAFHHVDYNPEYMRDPDKIRRRKTGHNRLQASLSLDDEDDENCTVVIDGLHKDGYKDLYRLWDDATRVPPAGPVVYLGPKHLTPARVQETIGRTYRPAPVCTGGVRFMKPVTFHGSTALASKTRRVLFPWYTRVDSASGPRSGEERSFETDALSPPDDYIRPIVTLTAPPTTGGGQCPIDTRMPFRFPASSFLLPGNMLSAAIVGVVPWDQPAVRATAREFFRSPYEAIRRQRREMVRTFKWHMEIFRAAEQEAYGQDSFYASNAGCLAVSEIREDWVDSLDQMHLEGAHEL